MPAQFGERNEVGHFDHELSMRDEVDYMYWEYQCEWAILILFLYAQAHKLGL